MFFQYCRIGSRVRFRAGNLISFKEPRIVGLDTDQGSATIQNAVIAGVIAAMLICIVGILFVVHRIKKKDEGSYKISASPS